MQPDIPGFASPLDKPGNFKGYLKWMNQGGGACGIQFDKGIREQGVYRIRPLEVQ
jgi:hypothetical protein